jgi:hypothetical protein
MKIDCLALACRSRSFHHRHLAPIRHDYDRLGGLIPIEPAAMPHRHVRREASARKSQAASCRFAIRTSAGLKFLLQHIASRLRHSDLVKPFGKVHQWGAHFLLTHSLAMPVTTTSGESATKICAEARALIQSGAKYIGGPCISPLVPSPTRLPPSTL